MYRVIKRDNSIVDFNLTKIKDAMSLAFQSRQKPCHPDVLDLLALKVTADFSSKVKDELVNVEDIQDSVESVLIQAGYADVAKAYILYRRQREKLRNMKNTFLDYRDTVNKYLNVTDWRVKENSTVTYSVGGLILSNSGAITANYWLSEVYDDEIANAHRTCEFHLHDLSLSFQVPSLPVAADFPKSSHCLLKLSYHFHWSMRLSQSDPDRMWILYC